MNDKTTLRPPWGLKNIFYGWWIVLACFIIGFYAGAIIFYGFTAFFDPLVKEFGWSYTEISFAVSILGVGMWIIGIPLVFVIRDTPEEHGLYPDGRKMDPPVMVKPGEANDVTDEVPFRIAIRHKAFLTWISLGIASCFTVLLMLSVKPKRKPACIQCEQL